MADMKRCVNWGIAACCLGAVPPLWAQAAAPDGPEWAYPVQRGDTLIDIAARHLDPAIDWPRLLQLNRLPDPRRLKPGSLLRIPLAWLRHDPVGVEVLHLRGDVRRISGLQSTPLVPGERLRQGDRVEAGPQSSATLRFADGSRLLLTPDSSLLIDQAGQHADSRSLRTRVGVPRGSAETQVDPQAAARRRFEISTPAANLGVRGTEFRTHAGADSTHVEVLAGRVAVGPAVSVDGGFGSVARPGQAVSAPVRLADPPDLSGLAERVEQLPLRLEWPAVPGAVGYRAQLFVDGPQGDLLRDGRFDTPSATWPTLPDGAYQLRVRVVDPQGLEGKDAQRALRLATQPPPPLQRQPLPGSTQRAGPVTLRWAGPVDGAAGPAAAGATGYRLQVASRADFSAPEIDQVLGPVAVVAVALAPGHYHWRLATLRATGERGPFGAAWPFSLLPALGAPVAGPPMLERQGLAWRWRWQAVAGAEAYQVQAAHEAGFADPLVDLNLAGLDLLLPLAEPGRYALRVRAVGPDGVAGPFGPLQWVDVSPPAWGGRSARVAAP